MEANADVLKKHNAALSTTTNFAVKLFQMVRDEDDSIVQFVPDGSAFEVVNPKALETRVLPRYFRHSRFQSLVRQLNFYNFKKISRERSMWIYRHDMFHRDLPELLEGLKRKTNGTAARRKAADKPDKLDGMGMRRGPGGYAKNSYGVPIVSSSSSPNSMSDDEDRLSSEGSVCDEDNYMGGYEDNYMGGPGVGKKRGLSHDALSDVSSLRSAPRRRGSSYSTGGGGGDDVVTRTVSRDTLDSYCAVPRGPPAMYKGQCAHPVLSDDEDEGDYNDLGGYRGGLMTMIRRTERHRNNAQVDDAELRCAGGHFLLLEGGATVEEEGGAPPEGSVAADPESDSRLWTFTPPATAALEAKKVLDLLNGESALAKELRAYRNALAPSYAGNSKNQGDQAQQSYSYEPHVVHECSTFAKNFPDLLHDAAATILAPPAPLAAAN